MTLDEEEKIRRFIRDERMSDAVREVIECEITKPTKDRDVQNLAARFLAIEILRDAWKELGRYKDSVDEKSTEGKTMHV